MSGMYMCVLDKNLMCVLDQITDVCLMKTFVG